MNTIRRPIVMSPSEQRRLLRTVDSFRLQSVQWQNRAILWKAGCIGLSILCLALLISGHSSKSHALKLATQICAIRASQP